MLKKAITLVVCISLLVQCVGIGIVSNSYADSTQIADQSVEVVEPTPTDTGVQTEEQYATELAVPMVTITTITPLLPVSTSVEMLAITPTIIPTVTPTIVSMVAPTVTLTPKPTPTVTMTAMPTETLEEMTTQPTEKIVDVTPSPEPSPVPTKFYNSQNEIHNKRLLVKMENDSNFENIKENIKSKLKLSKLNLKKSLNSIKVMEINENDDIKSIIKEFNDNPNVAYAQPDYPMESFIASSNTGFTQEWGLLNNGQTINGQVGTPGIDINAVNAWKLTKGDSSVLVGVLDTGIDVNHSGLKDCMDIQHGYDFVNHDDTVFDSATSDTHGTSIAGIIAANGKDQGTTGAAPQVKILPLKFMSGESGYTSDAIAAIEYAQTLGVKIINCSWGSLYYNPALKEAMANSDILFVCSSGNGGNDVIKSAVYPSCFDLPNVISVGAINNKGQMPSFSGYGTEVDVAAPGVDIFTTIPGNQYDYLSGTSMAAAEVTGVAALLKSYNHEMTCYDMIKTLKSNVKVMDALKGKVKTGGILDAYACLKNIKMGVTASTDRNNDPQNSESTLNNINKAMTVDANDANNVKYPKAAYKEGRQPISGTKDGVQESISTEDGSLDLHYTDYILKGRNGFDLAISRNYNSLQSNIYESNVALCTGPLYKYHVIDVTTGGTVPSQFVSDFIFNTCDEANQDRSTRYNFTVSGNTTKVDNADGSCTWTIVVGSYTRTVTIYPVVTINDYGYYDILKNMTSNDMSSDLGAGWSFDFPYIEIRNDGTRYLHYGSAGVFPITLSLALDQYPFNDISLSGDTSYSNGQMSSSYLLKEKDGKKYFFAQDGRLLGIKDRFDNEYKFQHIKVTKQFRDVRTGIDSSQDCYYISKISEIEKTTGNSVREITFNYTDNQIKVTIQDPNNISKIKTIQYNKAEISGKSGEYILDNVVTNVNDIESQNTSYSYDLNESRVSLIYKRSETIADPYTPGLTYSYLAVGSKNYNALLKTVRYSTGGESRYNYVMSTKNCGNGYLDFYKVQDRADYRVNGQRYNYQLYNYKVGYPYEYDGYPYQETALYNNPLITRITDEYGNTEDYTYRYKYNSDYSKGAVLCVDVLKQGTNHKVEVINEYDDPVKRVVTKQTTKMYSGSQALQRIENFSYDSYRNLVGYWDPQAEGNTSNVEYKTTYSYDMGNYNILTGKTYKKDSTTEISEVYTLKPDNKAVDTTAISEKINGVTTTREKSQYFYDTYGNVTEVDKYPDINGKPTWFIATKYNYDDNDTSRTVKLNGVYLTKKWTTGVKDADGATVTGSPGFSSGEVGEIFKYDWFGNLISKCDGNGNTTSYQYDYLGRVTKQTNADTTSRTWVYTSNTTENSVLVTDERGNQFKNIYDEFGNLLNEQDYTTGENLKSYSYDDQFRMYTDSNINTSPNGRIITYTYKSDGRVATKVTKDKAGSTIASESYAYDDAFTDTFTDPTSNSNVYAKTIKTVLGDTNSPSIVTNTYTNKYGELAIQGRMHNGAEYRDTFKYDYLGNKLEETSARSYNEAWNTSWTGQYVYNYAGKVVKATNANKDYTTTDYDGLGRVTSVTDAKNNTTTYTYDSLGRVIKESTPFDSVGGITYYTVKKHYYDGNGNIKIEKVTNNSIGGTETYNQTGYEYNNRNMLTKVITYDNGNPANYTQYYYDASGNKIRMYTGLNNPLTINGLDVEVANGDPDYSKTKYEYDEFGKLTKLTEDKFTDDSTGQLVQKDETYVYDSNGNLTQKADRNGSIIAMEYDGLGRLTKNSVSNTGKPSLNASYSYTYTLTGNRATMDSTSYTYDDLGRLKTESLNDIVKTYDYDAADNRKSFILTKGTITKISTTYDYDWLNRLWHIFENGQTTTYGYDANGNRISLVYPNGNSISYGYKLANKLSVLTNSQNSNVVSKYEYTYNLDGNMASKKETVGSQVKATNYTYDGLGRLTNESVTGGASTCYTYDDYNNRSSMTYTNADVSPQGTVTYLSDMTWDPSSYVGYGSIQKDKSTGGGTITLNSSTGPVTYPKGLGVHAVSSVKFNLGGNYARFISDIGVDQDSVNTPASVTFKVIADGVVKYTSSTMYGGGVLQNINIDVTGVQTLELYVGDGGNGISSDHADWAGARLIAAVPKPQSYTTNYTYGSTNRLKTEIKQYREVTYLSDMTWDSSSYVGYGSIQSDKSTGGTTITLNSSAGPVTYAKGLGVHAVSSVKFNLGGNYTRFISDIGVDQDSVNTPASVTFKVIADGVVKYTSSTMYGGGVLQNINIDVTGVQTLELYVGDGGNGISSDHADWAGARLESVNKTQDTTNYSYDYNGNQTSVTKQTKDVVSGTTGTLTNVSSNQYNGFNQLISETSNGQTATTYTYNGDGLRISKTIGGVTTTHIWDGDQIAFEYDGSGNTMKYIRGINLITSETGAGTRKYYLYNGHGDVVQLTDTTGNVLKNYEYDAFGNEKNPDANDTNVFRYCGEYFDKETGHTYLRARYYNPVIGRFVTEDSFWGRSNDPLSLNLYTYCGNDPIDNIDPSGNDQHDAQSMYGNNTSDYYVPGTNLKVVDTTVADSNSLITKKFFTLAVGSKTYSKSEVGNLPKEFTIYNKGGSSLKYVLVETKSDVYKYKLISVDQPDLNIGIIQYTWNLSPALEGSPYCPAEVNNRVKPPYRANPAHDSKSSSYNPNKTIEPTDAAKVYESAVRSDMGTWYGKGSNGQVYRYFSDNAGGAHFSGIIPKSNVPASVLRQIGIKP